VVGVRGSCSSLFGVVVEDVGVGRAELRLLLFTCPMIGDEPSIIVGECSFRLMCCPLLVPRLAPKDTLFSDLVWAARKMFMFQKMFTG